VRTKRLRSGRDDGNIDLCRVVQPEHLAGSIFRRLLEEQFKRISATFFDCYALPYSSGILRSWRFARPFWSPPEALCAVRHLTDC